MVTGGSSLTLSLCTAGVVGALLLIRGLRGRRVGCEPRCRKCKYNLTGLTAEKCPECGSIADEKRVVWGLRRRRRRSLWAGSFIIGALAACFAVVAVGWLRNIDLYKRCPTAVLMQLAKFKDESALKEILQRMTDGTVSVSDAKPLIPVALEVQERNWELAASSPWPGFLASMEMLRALTNEQRKRFYGHLVQYNIETRPLIRRGEDLLFRLRCTTHNNPDMDGTWCARAEQLRMGSHTLAKALFQEGDLQDASGTGCMDVALPTHDLEPGSHALSYVVHMSYLSFGDADWLQPTYWQDLELHRRVEILPADAPETVTMVRDASMVDGFRKAMSFRFKNQAVAGTAERFQQVLLHVDHCIPMDAAFRVFGRIGDVEYQWGSYALKRSTTCAEPLYYSTTVPTIEADEVTIILRSSADVARVSVDLLRIWDGEIVFDSIPTEHDEFEPPSETPDVAGTGSIRVDPMSSGVADFLDIAMETAGQADGVDPSP